MQTRRLTPVRVGHDSNAWPGRFTCTSEVDEYLSADTLHCLLCWRGGFRSLGHHLSSDHGIKAPAYQDRFGIPRSRGLAVAAVIAQRREKARKMVAGQKAPADRTEQLAAFVRRLASGERARDLYGSDGMPSEGTVWGRRRADPEFDRAVNEAMQGRFGAPVSETRKARVIEGLRAGRSVASLDLGSANGFRAIYALRKRDPSFAAQVGLIWNPYHRLGAVRRAEQARRKAERAELDRFAPHRHREQFVTALRSDEVYAAVSGAARHLPLDMRDDVISDLVVALLDREITIADLPREVGRFRTAHNRMFGGYAPSLDAPIGDGGFTLGQTMASAYI